MRKVFFILLTALALVSCHEPVVSPEGEKIVGRLYMMTNPNWARDSNADVPILVLAIYTGNETYYVANPYTKETRDNESYITICDKQFGEGTRVRVIGDITTQTDVYGTAYQRIQIKSIRENFEMVEGEGYPFHLISYVYSYSFPSSMELKTGDFLYGTYPYDGQINSPYGFHVIFKEYAKTVGQWQEGNSDRELFDSLAIKHGDTNFHQDIFLNASYPRTPHEYLGIDFASITVTSNTDFDEEHIAGTPLNDLIQFMAYTPYPFIQSGYQYSTPKGDMWNLLKQETTLIDKPLSECTAEDFILTLGHMDNWGFFSEETSACYLHIKATPTLSKQHMLTVTIVDDADKIWQNTIKLNW